MNLSHKAVVWNCFIKLSYKLKCINLAGSNFVISVVILIRPIC